MAHSWYVDDAGGRHPAQGETRPHATGDESVKYSWTKAPRYGGRPAETGPLAEMLLAGDREKALEAGGDEFDIKPIQMPRLLEKIEAPLHIDKEVR